MSARTVWKYDVEEVVETSTSLRLGAQIVHVGSDHRGVPCLWALVDPAAHCERRTFRIYGTGHPIPDGAEHIGSWNDGPFMWHLFDLDPPH